VKRIALFCLAATCAAQSDQVLRNGAVSVTVSAHDGSYAIGTTALPRPVVKAQVGAELDGRELHSSEYPQHRLDQSAFEDELGRGRSLTVTHQGLAGAPDLICVLRVYDTRPFGDLEVRVGNTTGQTVAVRSVHILEAAGPPYVDLGGPQEALRVLADNFSEGRPLSGELARAPRFGYRGFNTELIYNRDSRNSLFLGAVTSRRFLTLMRFTKDSFLVDSTGTSEFKRNLAPEDWVDLKLPVAPGGELASERVMFTAGADYHAQLEAYGGAVRVLKHARVDGPTLMGWWSWTAFYSQISEGTLLTEMTWLAEHLKKLGYDFFHIDEGYMYTRGEYATPDAARFPNGMRVIGRAICRRGLKFGIWTAPFEVTDRSEVYEHHQDWLVHNAAGKPILLGKEVTKHDSLYALDTTHPAAQEYLKQMFRTLVNDWGVQYMKLDFMDETAVEGYRYRPNITAMEAQQIGLRILREAVGENVLLDKDGSPVLNTVGYVDEGRISVDTAHDFARIRNVAPGIAARYYMHRNFFVSDPDGFCVSKQTTGVMGPFPKPLSQSEAETSIVLAAVSGGMFEIGDDLEALGAEPERLALVTNRDLIRMAKLSRASVPLDLMNYLPEDEQPSLFWLREDRRQGMLAVFNWTDRPRSHKISFAELKLAAGHPHQAFDVLAKDKPVALAKDAVTIDNQPPHSVRLLKIIDTSLRPAAPTVTLHAPASGVVGEAVRLAATAGADGVPALGYEWNFGDGTVATGAKVEHTYTRAGDYRVQLAVEGVEGVTARPSATVKITGTIHTPFPLSESRRYRER
jgi:alpha-galactosidase